ncbi:MAG: AAA family ATPase [Gemmatimonadota bacterium]
MAGTLAEREILGRDAELSLAAAWLGPGADGQVAPGEPLLVIEGEPGIGKTTLWAEILRRAGQQGWQVLSCRPARSDAGLSYAGLADLLRPVPDGEFGQLPAPQRRPLAVALLREEAGEGNLDPRAVGTGLTGLLGALAGTGPLLLAIDDFQWLDPASARAVAFALRRLGDRPVRLLTALRVGEDAGWAASGLSDPGTWPPRQRLPVGPLSVAALHQLLRQALGASFARPVLVRVHRAAGGNPFYALEMASELHRLGVPPPGQPLPVPGDHRDLALLRLRRLPRATRDVLAVVAAQSHPSAAGLDLEALAPAERAGIARVRPDGRVELTHPLFGSALYGSLPAATRRALHRDLAARAGRLEERARHLALATAGPDEPTAAILDEAAGTAAARGAADAAVELRELARQLTPPGDRAAVVRRELALADCRYFAGDPSGARRDLERALGSLPPGEDRAGVLLELGSVLWTQGEGDGGQARLAQALSEAETPALRARIHARISALAEDCDLGVEHSEAALALLDEQADPLLYSFSLHNRAMWRLYAGRGADHADIERGMRLQQDAATWEVSTVPAVWARNFDDFALARERFTDLLRVFSGQGDEASSCGVLAQLAYIEALTGRMERARALAGEALDLASQTEQETYLLVALCARGRVLALAGDLAQARADGAEMLRRLEALPDRALEGLARSVLGLAALSSGDLAEADRQLSRADEITQAIHAREPAGDRYHADHAEAVIGLGDLARAATLVSRLEARARALPRPWILAVSARCRGLLNAARGDLDGALASYEQALAAHQGLDMPVEHGRTLLALGRLCRRRNERQRAAASLAEAARLFAAAGAAGWAAVARDERDRARAGRGDGAQLTRTEQEIAELAGAGLRNHEIAARLFLSPKTVEANLTRAYRKLGVRSRAELARRLPAAAAGPAADGGAGRHPRG